MPCLAAGHFMAPSSTPPVFPHFFRLQGGAASSATLFSPR
ncbi:hypothetical protein EPYR_03098 [Erwinia pyrifoliae DSM 12163]|nr:hypothetical protein EPYR_03098 [Erwinia pyrifoliae DSM 12163]